jgi:hypothetical protein
VTPVGFPGHRYRWAVTGYDRVYRFLRRLDTPASEVGPALRIELRRNYRTRRLSDATVVRPGDRIGVIHLNNERVAALASDGLSPLALGIRFRRQFDVSLRMLARLAADGGPLALVRAFSATTIFYRGLTRLGFEADPRALRSPRLVASCQRALLASLKPGGVLRLRHLTHHRAQRLWISRDALLTRYGARRTEAVGDPEPPSASHVAQRLDAVKPVTD